MLEVAQNSYDSPHPETSNASCLTRGNTMKRKGGHSPDLEFLEIRVSASASTTTPRSERGFSR